MKLEMWGVTLVCLLGLLAVAPLTVLAEGMSGGLSESEDTVKKKKKKKKGKKGKKGKMGAEEEPPASDSDGVVDTEITIVLRGSLSTRTKMAFADALNSIEGAESVTERSFDKATGVLEYSVTTRRPLAEFKMDFFRTLYSQAAFESLEEKGSEGTTWNFQLGALPPTPEEIEAAARKKEEEERKKKEALAISSFEDSMKEAKAACDVGEEVSEKAIEQCTEKLSKLNVAEELDAEQQAISARVASASRRAEAKRDPASKAPARPSRADSPIHLTWSDDHRTQAAALHAELSLVLAAMSAKMKKAAAKKKAAEEKAHAVAAAQETQCRALAESIFSKDNIFAWKKCMSAADLSSTAREFAATDSDLYTDHMQTMARSCAGSFKAMEAAYRKCPPAMEGGMYLSEYFEESEFEYSYDGDEEELELEYLVREKLFPDE